jgi:hypothetical protein
MYLKRKQNAPIVKDSFGVEHPDLIIGFYAVIEDKLNKWLDIRCGYYHSLAAFNNNRNKQIKDNDANIYDFQMLFNNKDFVLPNLSQNEFGMPTYSVLKQDIEIDNDGNIIPLNEEVSLWILHQGFFLDFEGKRFNENWEVVIE